MTATRRAGVYLAVSQAEYPVGAGYSIGQDFVTEYSKSGLFSTIMLYAQAGTSDFTNILNIATATDSIANFKMAVVIGFQFDSSSDWTAVNALISDLASHPSVGWVGIEGEHSTILNEFGVGDYQTIGQAWNDSALSETDLENYFSEFNSAVTGAGLAICHYYVTFGTSTWKATQPAVWVSQWPACGFDGADIPDCSQTDTDTSEISEGNSSPYIGISAGLSTNVADYWNPTISSTSSLDDIISTYITIAEEQSAATRQFALFETGAYGYIHDWDRSIFQTDLSSAMSGYSDWIYPGASTPALSVSISGSPFSGIVPLTVDFTSAVSSGTAPYSYGWGYGDGYSGASSSGIHVYSGVGTYYPVLTVTDSSSPVESGSATIEINVGSSGAPLVGIIVGH